MKRIEQIVEYAKGFNFFADIGCDHGLISKSILKNPSVKRVFATDISEKCLLKARELLKDDERVEFFVGNGLKPIEMYLDLIDCIAICGMGAHTICDILKNVRVNSRLIIQPQNNSHFLRKFLLDNKFDIIFDNVAIENEKFYDIIVCKSSLKLMEYDKMQLFFGMYYKTKCNTLKEKLLMLKSKFSTYIKNERTIEYLSMINEALSFQD